MYIPGRRFFDVGFSPDGRFALFGNYDASLEFWDVERRTLIHRFNDFKTENNYNWVSPISVSPIETIAVTGIMGSNALFLWDLYKLELLRIFDGHASTISAVCFSNDGRYILSASFDSTIKIWDIDSGKLVQSIATNGGIIRAVSFTKDNQNIISANDRVINLWNITSGKLLRTFIGHQNIIQSLDCSSVESLIVSGGNDNKINLWDANNGNLIHTFNGHNEIINSVCFSSNGKFILSGSTDNTAKIWDVDKKRELVTLISVDSTDWVVTTPSGFFDASSGALKLMYYVVNDSTDLQEPWKVIELEQLKPRYYRPGLLSELLSNQSSNLLDEPILDKIKLPPTVRLSIQRNNLSIVINNRNGGIGKVTVFFNGAEVIKDLRSSPRQDSTLARLTYTIPLSRFSDRFYTLNRITVITYNAAGWLSSHRHTVEFRPVTINKGGVIGNVAVPRPTDSRLHAVVVGTSNLGLRYAHKDAENFANGLKLVAGAMLGGTNTDIHLLTAFPGTPKSATKTEIVKALKEAQKARPQDIFVLYLSGHGVSYQIQGEKQGEFFYLTEGATSTQANALSFPVIRQTYALSGEELNTYLNKIKASKKVLILDVCAAGKGAERLLAGKDVSASQQLILDRLHARTGLYILAGSAADAASYESNELGQSFLTYAVLKGLRGEALLWEGTTESVDVEKLMQFAEKEVPLLARNSMGIQQPFYRKGIGTNTFPLGWITPRVRSLIPLNDPKPILIIESMQDDSLFRDKLRIQDQVDETLIRLSNNHIPIPFLLVKTKDYTGAYKLNGRYKLNKNVVELTCRLSRENALIAEFVIQGHLNQLPNLTEKVILAIEKKLKSP